MAEPTLARKQNNGEGGEILIAFADAYEGDLFFVQELVADDRGRYIFFDAMPIEDPHWNGERVVHNIEYKPLDAIAAWRKQTGQRISQLDFFKALGT